MSEEPSFSGSPLASPGEGNSTAMSLSGVDTNDSLYSTALEHSPAFTSFNESLQYDANRFTHIAEQDTSMNCPTDFEDIIQSDNSQIRNSYNITCNSTRMVFIKSESLETNDSQEEIDPKSQLANKTIFKTDNPNLSIIEINDNSFKEQDLENSVVLLEQLPPNVAHKFKKSSGETNTNDGNSSDKRRKKAEIMLQCSKQKLDVAVAEALAKQVHENFTKTKETQNEAASDNLISPSRQPGRLETKREIKIYDALDEFEKNLPPTVTLLETPFGSKVYLVGTAHFSEESQDDVSFVIRNVRPDVVMVELCPSRIHILKLDEQTLLEEAKNFNLSKIRGIIQAHGYVNGIFFILLLQMSAQIAKDLGMAPGGEFRRAFEEVHKLPGCILHLGDRPIRITLHRALRALSLWQTIKLVWRLTSTDTISIEEVEECKQRDLLEKLMQEMAGEFPAFSDVFVKERDMFLCHSLQLASLPQVPSDGSNLPRPVRVVGVVGIGHANGIAEMWGKVDLQTIPEIMEIPPARTSTRICKFTVKYGLIGLTLFGAYKLLRPRLTRFF